MSEELAGAVAPDTSTSIESSTPPASEPVDMSTQMAQAMQAAEQGDFWGRSDTQAETPEIAPTAQDVAPQPVDGESPEEATADDVDLWTYLQQQEEQAATGEASSTAELEQFLASNPEALAQFKAMAEETAQLGEQWQSLTEKVGGDAEAITQAVDLYALFQRGAEPLEDGTPAYVQAALQLYEQNPQTFMQTTGGFLRLAMSDPSTSEVVANYVLQQKGLNPELLQDYKSVTMDGGYYPITDAQTQESVLQAVEELRTEKEAKYNYQKAFQAAPEKVRQQLADNIDDPQYLKFILDGIARDVLSDEEKEAAKRDADARAAQQLEFDATRESNQQMRSALSDHVSTLIARGVNEQVAKQIAFDVLMDVWGGYFSDDSEYAKIESELIEAYRHSDKRTFGTAKARYYEMFQKPLKSKLSGMSTQAAGVLAKKKAGAAAAQPGARHFTPDAKPGQPSSSVPLHERMQAAIDAYR